MKTKNSIKILVVDDEEVMRSLLTDVLSEIGYKVSTVKNGAEAIELLGKNFFEILFVDIHMPVLNGLKTLEAVREISPKSKVVMMDSFPDAYTVKKNLPGAVSILVKPFNIGQVTDIVEKIRSEGEG